MEKIKKALIVTVYNEENTIDRLLDSITTQTEKPSEVIFVDGGSQDLTVQKIKEHRGKFAVYIKKGNRSIGRNEAIKRSKAEIITITDAGCILDKNWFKNITLPFKDKDTDVVAGYYKAKAATVFQKSLVPYVLVMPDKVNPNDFLPATRSMAVKKSVWKEIGGFDEKLSNNEDYAFAKKLQANGLNIKFAKSAIVYWIPRSNLFQAYNMFYRFAKGDAEAKIFRPKVLLIFLRYVLGLLLLLSGNWILLGLFLFLYTVWSIWKNYVYIKSRSALFYLPLLQFTSDIAVLSGSSVALISKFYILFLFSFFLLLFIAGINYPYVGQNAYNFITYSLIAHNYNQFGFVATKLGSVISVANKLPQTPDYFIHHPPLLSIVISIFLKIFGEGFWVARLVMGLFMLASALLFYLIGLKTRGSDYSKLTFVAFMLIPATIIFGRLVGQEPLVLFFILTTTYFAILYLKYKEKKYLLLSIISICLATFSDWPATYFSIFVLPLFAKYKKLKLGLLLPLFATSSAAISALWIAWIRSGFWDLRNAIESRSFLELSHIYLWPLFWLGSEILRLFIYFNPFVVLTAAFILFGIYKRLKVRKLDDIDAITLIFLGFGVFHIAFYTEASFTHPYLIIYLLPFFVFALGSFLEYLKDKKHFKLMTVFIFVSLIYLSALVIAKNEQIESNIWRYQLALKAREYLVPYETIVYNKFYVVDPDIWRFPLLINPVLSDKNSSSSFLKKYDHYIYSCSPSCSVYVPEITSLKKRYKYALVKMDNSEEYIFFLQRPQNNENEIVRLNTIYKSDSWWIKVYRDVRESLKVPQI